MNKIDPAAVDAQKRFIDRVIADAEADHLMKAVNKRAKAMVKASKRKPAKRAKKR